MTIAINSERQSVLPQKRTRRKEDKNRFGTLRNIKGKIYFSFKFLGIWVKAYSNLDWNEENLKIARYQLDKIGMAILDGTFRFKQVFPRHRKADFFAELERKATNRSYEPNELTIGEFAPHWIETIKASGRITERTLLGYQSLLDNYINPLLGEYKFSEINGTLLEIYYGNAKKLELRSKVASNKTLNKSLVPLKMMCKMAAIQYGWNSDFNPFFGHKKLPENDSDYEIRPFTIEEQRTIIDNLDVHWKPFFTVAFRYGLRQGEQLALVVDDINFERAELNIRRALTLDENGKPSIGNTKNNYSKRSIHLLPDILQTLSSQVEISKSLESKFLFCTPNGSAVQRDNLRGRVWAPALEAAGLPYRPLLQTRHSFATTALSAGESPLWIAQTMGHSTAKMVLEVYSKYVRNAAGSQDGDRLSALYSGEK